MSEEDYKKKYEEEVESRESSEFIGGCVMPITLVIIIGFIALILSC